MSRKALIDCDNTSAAFNSSTPQYFHKIFGKALCEYVVDSVLESGFDECYIKAIDNGKFAEEIFADNPNVKILKTEQEIDALKSSGDAIIVFHGDAPLYEASVIHQTLADSE